MSSWAGPGPVFVYEWTVSARRARTYAARAFFGLSLLAAMFVGVWSFSNGRAWPPTGNDLAILARFMYEAVVGVQLSLLLLAAPAATAGAICVDKARGTLAHVLTTDLSNAEIVLGKLAARWIPVLSLIACSLPIVMLCTLFGGIDPWAISGAYVVMLGVALLGCSLALALSLYAKKTHEVLLAVYLFWIVSSLSRYIAFYVVPFFGGSTIDWIPLDNLDPFGLAFATYDRPGTATFWDFALFFGVCLGVSAILTAIAVAGLRSAARRDKALVARRKPIKTMLRWKDPRFVEAVRARLPRVSLDFNPVLWREWHRNRPSRWTLLVWVVYASIALGMTLFCASAFAKNPNNSWYAQGLSAWTNGLQAAIGILLLCVLSSTSLSEERERGSLDILMATPISTRSIVWGKWLGAFRGVPALTILPAGLALWTVALGGSAKWIGVFWIFCLILAYGAWATSMGLALAIWIPKLGRAVAFAVAADLFVTVGWIFLLISLFRMGPDQEGWMMISPFFGPGELTFECGEPGMRNHHAEAAIVVLAYLTASAGILLLAYLNFDRRLGRITLKANPGERAAVSRPKSSLRSSIRTEPRSFAARVDRP